MFHTEDYELLVLQHNCCPFCRRRIDESNQWRKMILYLIWEPSLLTWQGISCILRFLNNLVAILFYFGHEWNWVEGNVTFFFLIGNVCFGECPLYFQINSWSATDFYRKVSRVKLTHGIVFIPIWVRTQKFVLHMYLLLTELQVNGTIFSTVCLRISF